MIDIALLSSLKGSDCIDDVCATIGVWANGKYTDVCQELDDANETIASLQECVADNTSDELDEAKRTIVKLKEELDFYIAKYNASDATTEQYEYEIKGLQTTIDNCYADKEVQDFFKSKCIKDFNDLHTTHEELETKYKQLKDNSVERRRYDAMLTDYIDLVSKVKDGTALSYIMSLK
jgi:chromosome segregation ATPase